MRFKLFVAQLVVLILFNIATAQFQLESAFPSLIFVRPVDLQHANDQSNRLFVVEQAGIIKVFQNDSSVSSAGEFLNITGRVDDGGNEEGLLGLAFHPDYQNNGYFYVNYTANQPNRNEQRRSDDERGISRILRDCDAGLRASSSLQHSPERIRQRPLD